MQTKDELIQENTLLRARLELAERWMQREVQMAMQGIQKQSLKKETRKHFANLLEEEGLDIIARRIHEIFGEGLRNAPEFTLERFIDAEIYWQTLQKYPTMDGLPIILAYQKILDAWIEKQLVSVWRNDSGKIIENHGALGLERDVQNILAKKYTLSIGRFFQILQGIRERERFSPTVSHLVYHWKTHTSDLYAILISDGFFLPFSELMNREIFTKKRHENKVTFGDVKKTREILLEKGLLGMLFASE